MTVLKAELKAYRLWQLCLLALATLLYGAACVFLYHRQAIGIAWDDSYAYVSDLPIQLGEAYSGLLGENNYSLNAVVFYFLHWLAPGNKLPVAVFLAAASVAIVYATYILLRTLLPKASAPALMLAAWLCSFAMSLYLPGLGLRRYVGTFGGALWHNHTYTTMKLFALLTLTLFVGLYRGYRQKLHAGKLLLFTLFLTLCAFCKPSFFTTFIPAFGVMLLINLIRARGRHFGSSVCFACSAMPGVFILWLQGTVLFGRQATGFTLGVNRYLGSRPIHALLVLALAFLLMIYTLACLGKPLKALPISPLVALNAGFAFLQFFFLVETGAKATHQNFLWGVQMATAILFIWCAAAICSGSGIKNRLGWIVLALHAFFGAQYFIMLLMGNQYYVV